MYFLPIYSFFDHFILHSHTNCFYMSTFFLYARNLFTEASECFLSILLEISHRIKENKSKEAGWNFLKKIFFLSAAYRTREERNEIDGRTTVKLSIKITLFDQSPSSHRCRDAVATD